MHRLAKVKIRQRRPIDRDALPRQDLRLAIGAGSDRRTWPRRHRRPGARSAGRLRRAAAARAGGVFRFDDDFDPRQVLRQRPAAGAPLVRTGLAQRRIGLLLLGFAGSDRLFEVFQAQIELVRIELIRALAELNPPQLAKQARAPPPSVCRTRRGSFYRLQHPQHLAE
jgi:hypothetical protein